MKCAGMLPCCLRTAASSLALDHLTPDGLSTIASSPYELLLISFAGKGSAEAKHCINARFSACLPPVCNKIGALSLNTDPVASRVILSLLDA